MNEQTQQTLTSQIISHALEDESFKQKLLSGSVAAKAAIEQLIGQKLPEDLEINVLEETNNLSYITIPAIASVQEISKEELEAVAGGGVTLVTITTGIRLPCTMGSATFH
ncbi:MAG: NHLP leader peptide family RiPP precursor [Rivularia sp. (in: cyanobacteria)]